MGGSSGGFGHGRREMEGMIRKEEREWRESVWQ
jgi:hypothetical protein